MTQNTQITEPSQPEPQDVAFFSAPAPHGIEISSDAFANDNAVEPQGPSLLVKRRRRKARLAARHA